MKADLACLICGEPLAYHEDSIEMTCEGCGKKALSNAACVAGHFICDECHSSAGRVAIRWQCAHTSSKNPVELAQALMELPSIHMHGPEHHSLVGSALLAAYRNSGGAVELEPALQEMERRSRAVPGGICGLWGCCGAAVSAGMFMSLITGATPLTEDAWGLGNLMTSACLKEIGSLGGPRCCKRDSFLAIQTAVRFCAEHTGIQMELPEYIRCTHSSRNRECLGRRCPFHA